MKLENMHYVVIAVSLWTALTSPSARSQNAGDDPYAGIIKREFGTASNEMAIIEKQVQSAKPEQYSQIESRLVAVLNAPEATMAGKQFACQMLRIVGSTKCLPTISKLLTDEKLSHMARAVLL